jgi:acetoacetyl-CoA synthetase
VTTGPIWRASPARIAATGMERFRLHVEANLGSALADSNALHRWTVEHPGRFWSTLWSYLDLPGVPGQTPVERGDHLEDAVFFPHGTIDVAAALLGEPGDEIAIIETGESGEWRELSRTDLHRQVRAVSSELRAIGIGAGDVVAAWTPNVAATVVSMIATLAVGATFTSASSDFGAAAVLDRFRDLRPRVILVAAEYRYGGRRFDRRAQLADIVAGLPALERIIVIGPDVPSFDARAIGYDVLVGGESGVGAPVSSVRPFNDPGWILYSSGTTGKPKAIVHRAGGVLLKHLSELRLHCDVRDGDVVLYFTTTGWMMWNWLGSALAARSTIVLYDGSPTYPHDEVLFEVAARSGTTYFGASARYFDTLRRAGRRPRDGHDLGRVRTVASTGSPLAPDTYRWVYDAIGEDVHLISKSGGTDLCGGLVTGDPTGPVFAGELQMPALGLAVDVLDDAGASCPPGVVGELVCATPFPSMPLRFVDDPGDQRLHDAYYRRFPGHWHQSDFATWTTNGGVVIHGRSDATLNAGGVRIGTSEIYAVLADIPDVTGGVAVGHRVDSDTRVLLLVTLADGAFLDEQLVDRIRTELRDRCSPRHVPAVVVAVDDLPRTSNGKMMELLVADLINGDEPRGLDSVANPDSVAMVRRVKPP